MGHGSSVEAPPLEVLRAVAEGQPAAQVAAKRASGYAAAAAGRESAARRLQELSSSLEGRALEQPARRLLDLSSSLEGRPLDPSRMRARRDAAGPGPRRAARRRRRRRVAAAAGVAARERFRRRGGPSRPREALRFQKGDTIPLAKARVVAFVGSGAFGDVYRVDVRGRFWAMKAIRLGGAETGERSGSALERRAKLELDLCNEAAVALCVPPHRRVAALRFLTPDPRSPTELLVFSDFVDGATLAVLLSSARADRSDSRGALYKRPRADVVNVAKRLTAQLFAALAHCHGAGVLHCDRSRAELTGCTRTYASPETARLLEALKATRNPLRYGALKRAHPASAATTDLWAAALTCLQIWGGPVGDLEPWDHGRGELGGAALENFLKRPLAPEAAREGSPREKAWAPPRVVDGEGLAQLSTAVRRGASLDGDAILKSCLPPFEESARVFARRGGLRHVAAAKLRAVFRSALAPYPLPKIVRRVLRACLAAAPRDRPAHGGAVVEMLRGEAADELSDEESDHGDDDDVEPPPPATSEAVARARRSERSPATEAARAALARAGDAAAHAAYAQRMLRDAVRRADGAAVAELVEDEAFPPSWRRRPRGCGRGPRRRRAGGARAVQVADAGQEASTLDAVGREPPRCRARAAATDARLLDALGVDADLALQSAVDGGRLDAVLAMLEARPEGTLATGGATPQGGRRGDAAAVGALVERLGARVDGDPSGAVAPAHVAAGRGDADVLARSKERTRGGAPAEAGAPRTPLEHAASRGHDDAVDALLDLGAAPSPGSLLLAAERAANSKAGAGRARRGARRRVAVAGGRRRGADVLAAAAAALERRAGDARGLAALSDRESLARAGVARTAALGAWDHAVRVLAPAREKLEAARRFLSHLGAPDLAAARNAAGVDASVRDAASLVAGLDFASADLDAARVKRELLARLPAKKAADPLAGDPEVAAAADGPRGARRGRRARRRRRGDVPLPQRPLGRGALGLRRRGRRARRRAAALRDVAKAEGGGALAGGEGRPRRANSDGDRFASPWPDIVSLIEEGPKSRRRRSHDEGPAS
ncbi:hypothetical protein JL721_497 [Aureococcus anophagefferens]|nr:hypothetical protein JL721_497 [Aureococcus anophagefferens]